METMIGTQCARIAERLHLYKRKEYRGSELVFDSVADMVKENNINFSKGQTK